MGESILFSPIFFVYLRHMKTVSDIFVDYLYEYMAKTALPVTKIPSVFNTTAVQIVNHNKTYEFLLPYDREGVYKIVCMLIQNYDKAMTAREKAIYFRMGEAGYNGTPAILNRYAFECNNISLLEFYDLLQNVDDDFITMLRIKSFMDTGTGADHIGFSVQLEGLTLLDSNGLIGLSLLNSTIHNWKRIQKEREYISDFTEFLSGGKSAQLFVALYTAPKMNWH
jgi:hypothetical protein